MNIFKTVKSKFLSVAALILCAISALSFFVGCSDGELKSIEGKPKTVEVARDEIGDATFEQKSNLIYSVTGDTVSETAAAGYNSGVIAVSAGEKYVCSFGVKGKNTLTVIFTDAQNKVVSQRTFGRRDADYIELNNVLLTAPENSAAMIINSYDKQVVIKKLVRATVQIEINSQLPSTLYLGCLNCGEFDYGENSVSAATYKSEWEMMLSDYEYDVFMFEDVIDTFSSGVTADSILGANGEYLSSVEGLSDYLRVSTQYQPETALIIPLSDSIVGSSNVTARFYALRLTFHINGKHVAFYGLHLVAESHISADRTDGEYSLSQQLRQTQFAELIKDAEDFDESVFMGDFNAQEASEYEIFSQHGYGMGNCDGTTWATLRDIPADNIIVSGGITINSFRVVGDYILNTDHKPLFAEIQVKEND